ncbi:probable LRR receptor-like serine/threonine-protein kinase IRK isoform X2 [Hevea brasiliensis]|uniref:probable LRR receptor-like serine/threonine-protein kinase IRK isoform X2 n=1 Tax=Hevea brasiliensis TaxID=3981 RepID=UPI0025D6222D|nr:probable LRR receptor-like serine/threonine-protein kinase IRK isoform X2 [Hevea brasiliensis]
MLHMDISSFLSMILHFFILIAGIHNGNAQLVDCLDSDREALIDFKEGLKDPENRLSSWRGNNCCQWEEFPNWLVNISSLVYVDIRYSQLHGSIPLALSMLPILQFLHVEFNHLKANSSPLFQGSWKNLEVLNLGVNIVYGSIPSWFWDISGGLNSLNLSFNQLKGQLPNPLNLQEVAFLDLSSNLFEGPIPLLLAGIQETN